MPLEHPTKKKMQGGSIMGGSISTFVAGEIRKSTDEKVQNQALGKLERVDKKTGAINMRYRAGFEYINMGNGGREQKGHRLRGTTAGRRGTSQSLVMSEVWRDVVKYDPYRNEDLEADCDRREAETRERHEAEYEQIKDKYMEKFEEHQEGVMGDGDTHVPGACKRCGLVGHLAFECRNVVDKKVDVGGSSTMGPPTTLLPSSKKKDAFETVGNVLEDRLTTRDKRLKREQEQREGKNDVISDDEDSDGVDEILPSNIARFDEDGIGGKDLVFSTNADEEKRAWKRLLEWRRRKGDLMSQWEVLKSKGEELEKKRNQLKSSGEFSGDTEKQKLCDELSADILKTGEERGALIARIQKLNVKVNGFEATPLGKKLKAEEERRVLHEKSIEKKSAPRKASDGSDSKALDSKKLSELEAQLQAAKQALEQADEQSSEESDSMSWDVASEPRTSRKKRSGCQRPSRSRSGKRQKKDSLKRSRSRSRSSSAALSRRGEKGDEVFREKSSDNAEAAASAGGNASADSASDVKPCQVMKIGCRKREYPLRWQDVKVHVPKDLDEDDDKLYIGAFVPRPGRIGDLSVDETSRAKRFGKLISKGVECEFFIDGGCVWRKTQDGRCVKADSGAAKW